MIRIGGILAVVIIIGSIGIAFYFYSQEAYREVVTSDLGEATVVSDVKFNVQLGKLIAHPLGSFLHNKYLLLP